MEDRNSPEAIAARSAQPDPIVMYLVVKETLGMSAGKTAAQCAHASQMVLIQYLEHVCSHSGLFQYLNKWFGSLLGRTPDEPRMEIFRKWLNTSFRKVVLRADDKEWQKVKDACPNHVVVVDAGLTEIAAGSETVIGIWPMYRSEAPKTIKKLQVLK